MFKVISSPISRQKDDLDLDITGDSKIIIEKLGNILEFLFVKFFSQYALLTNSGVSIFLDNPIYIFRGSRALVSLTALEIALCNRFISKLGGICNE